MSKKRKADLVIGLGMPFSHPADNPIPHKEDRHSAKQRTGKVKRYTTRGK